MYWWSEQFKFFISFWPWPFLWPSPHYSSFCIHHSLRETVQTFSLNFVQFIKSKSIVIIFLTLTFIDIDRIFLLLLPSYIWSRFVHFKVATPMYQWMVHEFIFPLFFILIVTWLCLMGHFYRLFFHKRSTIFSDKPL